MPFLCRVGKPVALDKSSVPQVRDRPLAANLGLLRDTRCDSTVLSTPTPASRAQSPPGPLRTSLTSRPSHPAACPRRSRGQIRPRRKPSRFPPHLTLPLSGEAHCLAHRGVVDFDVVRLGFALKRDLYGTSAISMSSINCHLERSHSVRRHFVNHVMGLDTKPGLNGAPPEKRSQIGIEPTDKLTSDQLPYPHAR